MAVDAVKGVRVTVAVHGLEGEKAVVNGVFLKGGRHDNDVIPILELVFLRGAALIAHNAAVPEHKILDIRIGTALREEHRFLTQDVTNITRNEFGGRGLRIGHICGFGIRLSRRFRSRLIRGDGLGLSRRLRIRFSRRLRFRRELRPGGGIRLSGISRVRGIRADGGIACQILPLCLSHGGHRLCGLLVPIPAASGQILVGRRSIALCTAGRSGVKLLALIAEGIDILHHFGGTGMSQNCIIEDANPGIPVDILPANLRICIDIPARNQRSHIIRHTNSIQVTDAFTQEILVLIRVGRIVQEHRSPSGRSAFELVQLQADLLGFFDHIGQLYPRAGIVQIRGAEKLVFFCPIEVLGNGRDCPDAIHAHDFEGHSLGGFPVGAQRQGLGGQKAQHEGEDQEQGRHSEESVSALHMQTFLSHKFYVCTSEWDRLTSTWGPPPSTSFYKYICTQDVVFRHHFQKNFS